jgi:hypothetical protein
MMSLLPPFMTSAARRSICTTQVHAPVIWESHPDGVPSCHVHIADGETDMHRIGFIVPRRFQMMSLAALTVFEVANMPPRGPCYDVHVLSEHGGPVESSGGMTLNTEAFGDPAFDTIIVGSITEMKMPSSDAAVVAFVKEAAKASRRVTSICSGAFVLAEAGRHCQVTESETARRPV